MKKHVVMPLLAALSLISFTSKSNAIVADCVSALTQVKSEPGTNTEAKTGIEYMLRSLGDYDSSAADAQSRDEQNDEAAQLAAISARSSWQAFALFFQDKVDKNVSKDAAEAIEKACF